MTHSGTRHRSTARSLLLALILPGLASMLLGVFAAPVLAGTGNSKDCGCCDCVGRGGTVGACFRCCGTHCTSPEDREACQDKCLAGKGEIAPPPWPFPGPLR